MYRYEINWTTSDGYKVEHQVYTAEAVSRILADLETWGATDIELKSIKETGKEREEK